MAKKPLKKTVSKEKTKGQILLKDKKISIAPLKISKEAGLEKLKVKSISKPSKSKTKKDKLFLPFDYPNYKENKVSLMKAQLGVLRCLRNIENIKKLQDTKRKLKRELRSMLILSKKNYLRAVSDMPNVSSGAPEESKVKEIHKVDLSSYQRSEYHIEELDPLNQELTDIQNKIKKLSTYQR